MTNKLPFTMNIVMMIWIGLIAATVLYIIISELIENIQRLKIDPRSADEKRAIILYVILIGCIGGVTTKILYAIAKVGELPW